MSLHKIRLAPETRTYIIRALQIFFPFHGSQAYLFGSRTNITKKGGDIDMLIVLKDPKVLKNQLQTILDFETYITRYSGDQKIDTKIISIDELQKGNIPFIEVIKKDLVKIWEYHNE